MEKSATPSSKVLLTGEALRQSRLAQGRGGNWIMSPEEAAASREDNLKLVYRELGAYRTEALGTPCDGAFVEVVP